jgi:hypothetical protein
MASWFDNLARFFRNSPDMKTSIPPILITFSLVCFALVQNAQAVNPPPDGGYPGGNTAEGTIAQLKKDFRATVAQLTTRLDEQAAQLRKVSAKLAAAGPSNGGLELRKPAPQVVNNP